MTINNPTAMKRLILALIALLAICGSARSQEGRYETLELNSRGQILANVNVAVCTTLATTAASVTNNIATLTMASNPQTAGFLVGFSLTVSGFTGGDTYFNTTATIVAVSSTTISFTLVHANASAGTNGIVYMTGSTTQACAPLAALFTDNTGSFSSPNPFVSDGLGNVGIWAAAGPYYLQTYGPTVLTSIKLIGIGCVPGSSTGTCGVYLNGVNHFSGTDTFGNLNGICVVDGTQNATLAAAVTCASTSGVIEIPMFAVPALAGNVTIPTGVTLRFDGPSGITTTGFTLTINGPIVAPPTQIFFGTGTVTIGGSVGQVNALWFPGSDPCVQIGNALTALPSTGGVINAQGFQGSLTACASTLTINKPVVIWLGASSWTFNGNPGISVTSGDVQLLGIGGDYDHDIGSFTPTTKFIYAGAAGGTAVQFSAVSGASNQFLSRPEFVAIGLDCNSVASIGLQLLSVRGGTVRHNTFFNCTTADLDVNVVASLGEARDSQHNFIEGNSFRNQDATGAGGDAMRFGGDSGANTSYNTIVNNVIVHKNGYGLEDDNGDNNTFANLRVNRAPGGTGIGVGLLGTGASTAARGETFNSLDPGAGGVTQSGTGATQNAIYHYAKGNGAPEPTFTGILTWTEDDGNGNGWHIGRLSGNGGFTPTCSVTGAGTGATCALLAGSNDSWGIMSISTGTTPSASGTITLTYSASFGTNATSCEENLVEANAAWNARATIIPNQGTQASQVSNWDDNAVALAASTTGAYDVSYFCAAR